MGSKVPQDWVEHKEDLRADAEQKPGVGLKFHKKINFYYALSEVCNMRCKYCYVPEYNKANTAQYDAVAISAAKDLIQKGKDEGVAYGQVTLHGAEPTVLSAKALKEVVELFYEYTQTPLQMPTNGLNLASKRYLKELDGLQDKFRIGVSIDGPEVVHNKYRPNSYKRVMRAITNAHEAGFVVKTLSVISNHTVQYAKEWFEWSEEMKALGCYKVAQKPAHGEGYELTKEDSIEWAKHLIKYSITDHQAFQKNLCDKSGNSCMWYEFDVHGGSYSCNKVFNRENNFGNWRKEFFWQLQTKRESLYTDAFIHEDCNTCNYNIFCRSGCSVERVNGKALDCELKYAVYDKLRDLNEDLYSMFLGSSSQAYSTLPAKNHVQYIPLESLYKKDATPQTDINKEKCGSLDAYKLEK